MTRILITGKDSYIGRCFLSHVSELPDFFVEELDVQKDTWKSHDFSQYDVIFHVAAIVHLSNPSSEMASVYQRVNTQLPFDLAQKAKKEGVSQFIFMSSMSVYGEIKGPGVITRDTNPAPQSMYGKSKLLAEQLLTELSSPEFHVAILRPPMVYGPGAKGNYQRLSSLIRKLPLFPRVDNARSMIYIDNLSEFIRLLVKNRENGIFFPQNRSYVNTSELVSEIKKSQGADILLLLGFNWLLKVLGRYIPTFNKLFSNLVYSEEMSVYSEDYQLVSFSESIQQTEQSDKI